MIKVTKFLPAHLDGFEVQATQAETFSLQPDNGQFGEAWSALLAGRAIACGGIIEVWPGRAYLWGLLSVHAAPHMLALTRIARMGIAACHSPRIEMATDAADLAACRWPRLLGMEQETVLPLLSYLPGGRSAHLFSRIR